jgi:hypothetical protein
VETVHEQDRAFQQPPKQSFLDRYRAIAQFDLWGFPVTNDGKKTALVKWKPLQDRRPTEDEIAEWGREFPSAGIAIITGTSAGIIIVDADSEEAVAFLEQKGMPTTWKIKSPRAYHWYLKHPGFYVKSSQSKIAKDVDIKGDRAIGYGPGTVGRFGRIYVWEQGFSPADVELADPPDWLIVWLLSKSSSSTKPRNGNNGHQGRTDNRKSTADQVDVEDALSFVDSASRDTWLHIGMALRCELGEAGRPIWDAWSKRSTKFNEADQDKTWNSLEADGGITIATLFGLAREGGWPGGKSRRDGVHRRKPAPDHNHNGNENGAPPPQEPPVEPPTTARAQQGYFQHLGHDRGIFYFFSRRARQTVSLDTKSLAHRESLFRLAPQGFWENRYPGRGKNSDWDIHTAANDLMSGAYATGFYNPESVRGRGAWLHGEGLLLHLGDRLIVDGKEVQIADFGTESVGFCYDGALGIDAGLPHEPLTTLQGRKLAELARQFLWTKPLCPTLLLGWIVVAPLCGTLKWRPHIWLTGPAGCGKGTILDYFVKPLMPFRFPSDFTGGTTEAGIRQSIKLDALPAIYDESESEDDDGRRRCRQLLNLIRASSSATEKQAKGTTSGKAMLFEMRSSFLLSSIITLVDRSADRRRIGVLELRMPEDPEQWKTLEKELGYVTPDLGKALFARTVTRYDILRQNIATFGEQIGKHLGNTNAGQQYGPLMAGAYLLEHDEPVEAVDAYEIVQAYDWSGFGKPDPTEKDERQCLNAILSAIIPLQADGHTDRMTLGELIQIAHLGRDTDDHIGMHEARKVLLRYGLKVTEADVFVAHISPELEKLLRGPWQMWRNYLKRLPGAELPEDTVWFSGGTKRSTKLPWSLFEE